MNYFKFWALISIIIAVSNPLQVAMAKKEDRRTFNFSLTIVIALHVKTHVIPKMFPIDTISLNKQVDSILTELVVSGGPNPPLILLPQEMILLERKLKGSFDSEKGEQ